MLRVVHSSLSLFIIHPLPRHSSWSSFFLFFLLLTSAVSSCSSSSQKLILVSLLLPLPLPPRLPSPLPSLRLVLFLLFLFFRPVPYLSLFFLLLLSLHRSLFIIDLPLGPLIRHYEFIIVEHYRSSSLAFTRRRSSSQTPIISSS